ncbi:uncharacterized protein B0I36DRAFT_325257 [Microdochium trichocladiopsis]|uniref:Uncharacterized protein n=1 Tax=Microdochium trichocladiopsis TaxID=1682393 RepID=A0A9P8Y6B3_9PEZI|nr:uncharacterized protein B0I36DRAFT_325257 [Microdochium trichocladiopsis]KAH7029203.1 hypothetical protein B0I36DRAFT_325257 [Microdochium trichocladiopsis]
MIPCTAHTHPSHAQRSFRLFSRVEAFGPDFSKCAAANGFGSSLAGCSCWASQPNGRNGRELRANLPPSPSRRLCRPLSRRVIHVVFVGLGKGGLCVFRGQTLWLVPDDESALDFYEQSSTHSLSRSFCLSAARHKSVHDIDCVFSSSKPGRLLLS